MWTPQLLALHVISDYLIAIAYYSIPLLLVYFVRKRGDVPFSWIFVMFGVFIVACGTTHLLAIYEIWHGAYWLSGWVKALTAAASVGTAIMMVPLLPKALALRSPAVLDRLNAQLERSLREKEELLRLYEREQRVSHSFQEASLPTSLPAIFGLRLDAIYRAGASESEVGGDWYDALQLPSGKVMISVGDVAGRGLEAAVTMAKVRQAIRTVTLTTEDPAEILEGSDSSLRMESPGSMATAFVGIYDGAHNRLSYASAGHPPMLVRRPHGEIVDLETGGLPLGFRRVTDLGARTIDLEPGSLIVLYTDGLVETSRDIEEGLARLRTELAREDIFALKNPAATLVSRLLPGGAADDVAVLTVCVEEIGDRLQLQLPAVPESARSVRASLDVFMRSAGLSDDDRFAVQVATGEAVMNAVEHPYGNRPGTFEVNVERGGGTIVIEVRDFGAWRDSPQDGRGRGFEMMRKLCQEVTVTSDASGSLVRLTLRESA